MTFRLVAPKPSNYLGSNSTEFIYADRSVMNVLHIYVYCTLFLRVNVCTSVPMSAKCVNYITIFLKVCYKPHQNFVYTIGCILFFWHVGIHAIFERMRLLYTDVVQ